MRRTYLIIIALLAVIQLQAKVADSVQVQTQNVTITLPNGANRTVKQYIVKGPDTVIVLDKPEQVIITETEKGTQVKVIGVENEREFSYTYKVDHTPNDSVHVKQSKDFELKYPFPGANKNDSTRHWSIIGNGLYLGGGNCSMPEAKYMVEFGILNIMGIEYNSHHGQQISLGLGLNLREIDLKSDYRFVRDPNTGIIGFENYPAGIERGNSCHLWTTSIQFPLLYRQRIYKRLNLNIGGIMNWNVVAKCHTDYKFKPNADEQVDYHHQIGGLKYHRITFDAFGGISYNGFGVYFRYSPQNFLKKGYGPEIKNTWSVGVTLCL